MAIRPILTLPDPILRKKAKPIERVDADLRRLMDDMLLTMYDAPGIGLAAPQIGILRRLIVMDPAKDEAPKTPVIMVNPEILERSEEMRVHDEGCLSIPDFTAEIERPAKTRVELPRPRRQEAGDRAQRHLVDAGPARDRPSERRAVHRLSVAAEAGHDREEIHQGEASRSALDSTDQMLIAAIIVECAVAIIAILGALQGRPHLYGFALTFAIYVVYDLGRLLHWNVGEGILSVLFLIASLSALYAVWGLYREKA